MDTNIQDILHLKHHCENDNIYYKDVIKKILLDDPRIIHYLNTPGLSEDNPDDYWEVSIFPYYLISAVQDEVVNHICVETGFSEIDSGNRIMKYGRITFYIFCDEKEAIDKDTGVARHDILSALITDDFAWSNVFGTQLRLVQDKPYAMDNRKVMRTLIFEHIITNSISKKGKVVNYSGGK